MEAKKGIWKVSQGKGDRLYINCENQSAVMHPNELCLSNGLGVYGYGNLKDLAIAILRFEKEVQEKDSIINNI